MEPDGLALSANADAAAATELVARVQAVPGDRRGVGDGALALDSATVSLHHPRR